MKRGWIFFIFFILFSVGVFSQSETVTFNGTIPNLNLNSGVNNNAVDLSKYFSSNNTITYKFKAGNQGINGIEVQIEPSGLVDITVNTTGVKSIIFIADDDTNTAESNDVNVSISSQISEISFSPNSDALNITKGENKVFAVSTSQSVEWFVDNVKINHTQSTYQFTGELIKVYEIKAKIGSTQKIWFVSVLDPSVLTVPADIPEAAQEESVCGNGLKEKGEDCSSCPNDVQCSQGAVCSSGICVPAKSGFEFSDIILWLVLIFAIIIFVVFAVILFRKKDLLSKFKRPKKQEIKVEEKTSQALQIQENPYKTDNLEPLVEYFKKNLFNYQRNLLVQEALKQGWTQEQIDRALNQIGRENGQNKGNQENTGKKL